jgi:cysteine desulfurase/selenocysteine lyase
MKDVRADFPLLARREVIYLDSAATSQKPRQVLEAMQRFYETSNANVHRGVYRLAEEADQELEGAREAVRRFIGAPEVASVIFTHGTTESINLVAQGWAARRLGPGDEIAVTELEHHSNLLPWQRVAQVTGAVLRISPLEAPWEAIGPRTRLVAFSLVSNVLGTRLAAERMVSAARASGAAIVIDAAQAVPHMPVDVRALGCDFLAFSGHKMLGPTGIGVLWATRERLEEMEPLLLGGGMVREVFADRSTFLDAPRKFEAGTPPVAEAVGLGSAVQYLEQLGMEEVRAHAQSLAADAASRLQEIPGVTVHGPSADRLAVVSFNVQGIHPHDVATWLDQRGICVRAGNHCAQPLMRRLGITGTVRASVHVYSTREDIDSLASAVSAARTEIR